MSAIRKAPEMNQDRLSSVRDILRRIVLGSIRVKAHVVSADEREDGLRNLLNFGHSIGHAFEGILTPQILHGECVAIGMVLEAALARYLGVLHPSSVSRLTKCLESYGLPISCKDPVVQERTGRKFCSTRELMSNMSVDKKNEGKKKKIVLLSGIGRTHELKASVVADQDIKIILSAGIEVQPLDVSNIHATCTPPGSKSISNRVLLLAALGIGECRIDGLLHSDDTDVMLRALAEMQCASFAWEDDGKVLKVIGNGGQLQASTNEMYLGNAGTASRFITAVATLARPTEADASILTGNTRMKLRPIGALVEALQENGAQITYLEKAGSLPLMIQATTGFEGGDISLAATLSSQYVSAILMCAPYAKKRVTLRLVGGKPISQPYIDMTIAMMSIFGIRATKSTSETNTYDIPQGQYRNPSHYSVEGDASSATYPLAIAAITGTSCTVPNIGSQSLQGDARFAVDVLQPMGCIVEQTSTSTTVKGPHKDTLTALPVIDMELMTDAFLTASVLASVARGTTRITGIANQRVKECNRIRAMKDELAKFGVTSRELDDGIEIDGIGSAALTRTPEGVNCYDDHRVAMSFSVLATVAPKPTIIRERECVGKTWPTWWDALNRDFGLPLTGVDIETFPEDLSDTHTRSRRSLFIIGMRGAGKTTAGACAAQILGWPSIDLDSDLELAVGCTIPDLIKARGWEGFREKEVAVLKKAMSEKPTEHVFACGGGIVEIAEARQLLIEYHRSGGPVLLVTRDMDDVMSFLQQDNSRPAYVDDMKGVWLRRKPWYKDCSNYEYFSSRSEGPRLTKPSKLFSRTIKNITCRNRSLDHIMTKRQSFFVSLTMPCMSNAQDLLAAVIVGSDAVELRVDLLDDGTGRTGVPAIKYVRQQLTILQETVDLPIVFTVRTKKQGGKFPDDARNYALELYRLAFRRSVEFIDLEIHHPEDFLRCVKRSKGNTYIIASHHDPTGDLSWTNGSWVPYYNKALQYGDAIKLVGLAKEQEDNWRLEGFRSWAKSAHRKPLIAINMGAHGQLSRIQNSFLTPVTHPKLRYKAAPGQLSAAEIRTGLALHGVIAPKLFYLFGKPISTSRSPAMHNCLFRASGLPHQYSLFETDEAQEVENVIRADDFGGGSVTVPLKIKIMPYLDEVCDDAKVIGAVNTISVDLSRKSRLGPGKYLLGRNTDWQGMVLVLQHAGAEYFTGQAGLVIGGGGTARAAIYALHQMGYSPLYMVGRSPDKINAVIDAFPPIYQLKSIGSMEEATSLQNGPSVAIGTIPGDMPIDSSLQAIIQQLLEQPEMSVSPTRFLLEMAYKPPVTSLVELARAAHWATIPGLEVLSGQGYYQVFRSRDLRSDAYHTKALCSSNNGQRSSHSMKMSR